MTMKKTLNVLVPSVLALFVASAAHAGATFDTPQGKLNIGGDVEYDVTADNFNEGHGADATDSQHADGRLLLDINGERVLSNGNYAGFKLNPLWNQQGGTGSDDVWFGFGVKNDWGFKLGHFEAYDLSPAGQDTYVVGYGDKIYRAKDGRGRNNNGGQAMFTKENGQWHVEVATQFGEYGNTGYFNEYTGEVKNKDPLLVRPVVAWTGDTVTVAVGGEFNLITDAYVADVNAGGNAREDISDWSGYGATATAKVSDDLSIGLRGAYRAGDELDQYSVGPNVQYQNFFASYLFGKTEYAEDFSANDAKYNVVYASYKIPAVMGIDNFDMYLGASWGNEKIATADESTEELGGRVRFKYFF
jgi:hypothetical protein